MYMQQVDTTQFLLYLLNPDSIGPEKAVSFNQRCKDGNIGLRIIIIDFCSGYYSIDKGKISLKTFYCFIRHNMRVYNTYPTILCRGFGMSLNKQSRHKIVTVWIPSGEIKYFDIFRIGFHSANNSFTNLTAFFNLSLPLPLTTL